MNSDKVTKLNKGEWSEFYVLLKLLAEQRLYAADDELQKLSEIYYPVIQVIAGKNTNQEVDYQLDVSKSDIKIYNVASDTYSEIPRDSIKNRLEEIFHEIKTESKTFRLTTAEELRENLQCKRIKADSNKKTDIVLIVHDFKTNMNPEIGFSIKSQVGADPTLLNAGKTTNFTYMVSGLERSICERVNETESFKEKFDLIKRNGGSLEFVSTDNEVFAKNMRMIDTFTPEIFSEMLLVYYSGMFRTVSDIVTYLSEINPLRHLFKDFDKDFYAYKVKDFLATYALGMKAATPWDGKIEALGGYIILREDGEVVCYHLLNLDQFKEYLYKNTRLETASTSRHGFGTLYEEDGKWFMKLNLQIRFTN